MYYNYEERIKKSHEKFPDIRDALIEYWNTIYDLTKRIKTENFREKVWNPILNFELAYDDPKYFSGREGWGVKFYGHYPDQKNNRKLVELTIINLLTKIPNINRINSNIDITPFLDLTPHLILLGFRGCPLIEASPKLGTLKELNHLNFIGCNNLITLPDSIDGMQNLTDMEIEGCTNLISLPNTIKDLPKIRNISISDCDHFTSLPEETGDISELSSIIIESCNNFRDLPRSLSKIPWLEINIICCENFRLPSDFPSEIWKSCRILCTSPEEIWYESLNVEGANNYPDYEEFNNTIFDREITWEKLESWFGSIPHHAFDELIANALLLSAYSNSLDVELPINRPCKYKNEQAQNIVKNVTFFRDPTYSKFKNNPIYSKLIDIRGSLFSLFYDVRFSVQRNEYGKGYSKNIVEYNKLFSKVFIELVNHLDSWVEKNSNRLDLRNYLIEILNFIRPSFNLIKDNNEFNILL